MIQSNIILPYTPRYSTWSLDFRSPHQKHIRALSSSQTCHMSGPSHPSAALWCRPFWCTPCTKLGDLTGHCLSLTFSFWLLETHTAADAQARSSIPFKRTQNTHKRARSVVLANLIQGTVSSQRVLNVPVSSNGVIEFRQRILPLSGFDKFGMS
jgi:hypothetical protein